MSIWKIIEQSGGGVAVVIPAAHALRPAEEVAAVEARPTHVNVTLSDYGVTGQATGVPASTQIEVRSGSTATVADHRFEMGPVPIEGALDVTVQIAVPEMANPVSVRAHLDVEDALLSGPCYVAVFPRRPPLDLAALSVNDGQLQLDGTPIQQHDYALLRIVGTKLSEERSARALSPMIRWRDAQGIEGSLSLSGAELTVGRALDCAIRTDDGRVSRHHARIFHTDRGYMLEDLSSTTGVFFHEQRVQRHLLKHGDAVRCGSLWLRFVEVESPSQSRFSPMMQHPGSFQMTGGGGGVGGGDGFGAGMPQISDPLPSPKPAQFPGEDRSWAADAAEHVAKPVHWNTRVLDGERALDELFVTVGRAYTIETGLDPAPLPGALATSTIAPAGLPDGTKVMFEVSCPQPILRGHGDAAGEPVARVSYTGTYEAATGRCPPARFGLVPAARGRITLTLNVVTDNAIRASTLLTLQAELEASQPGISSALGAAPSPAPAPAPQPIAVSSAALTGPPAQLRFELTATNQIVVSDGVVTEKPRDPSARWGVLIGEAIRARAALVELSHAYRRADAPASELALADAPALRLRMAKIGAALHKAFFGKPGDRVTDLDVQNLAKAIADTPAPGAAARLQIVAAFQPFPWAVFYDGAYRGKPLTDDPASVDLSCFWGHRFRIDRMIMGHVSAARAPTLPAPVRVQACLNRHLDDEPAAKALGVKVVARQRALFDGLPGVAVQPRIESTDGFVAFLKSATAACDLLYVFCHATAAVTKDELFTYSDKAPDTQAKLIFDPPPAAPVDVRAMQDAREPPLSDRPLVFLNACSSAAGDELFQSPMLEQFLERWGAIGVVGTDWEVPTVFADAFAHRLLDHFLRGSKPLGEAFWLASHEAFAEGNPFPLVYALYARPDLTTTTTASRGGMEP